MRFLLYGAYGYTGRLIARLAVERGLQPILAGRDATRLEPLAAELGLTFRAFGLDSEAEVDRNLEGVGAVLHAAGPFSATSAPMVEAALRRRVHYLDITGEISVFEAVLSRDDEARRAGISLLPGVGFDVVPTDCLAAQLARSLPDATHLELAFFTTGGPSQGTAKSMVEALPQGGCIRENGRLVRVRSDHASRTVPFPSGPRLCVSVAWGDVSTAFWSTGIGNVVVYMALSPRQIRWLPRIERLGGLLGNRAVQGLLKWGVERWVEGPPESEVGRAEVWGEVRNAAGEARSAALKTPGGYPFTADSSVQAVRSVLSGSVPAGALTPSRAFGADFVTSLRDVELV